MTETKPKKTDFWDIFSPYMDYLENVLGINLDNLGPVIPLIKSPVLVVGAGQGLLISELRQKGFTAEGIDLSPEMVAAAERRRGIKLFLGNANNMPFATGQFTTTIVATGVIDFLEDSGQIGAIVNEVRRVTEAQGEILVALFGFTPKAEELLKYIGILSDNKLNLRMWLQIIAGSKSPPKEIIAIIRKDPGKSVPGLLLRAVKAFLSMRKRAGARVRALRELKRQVKSGNLENLSIMTDHLPECMFIRSSAQIRDLFGRLNYPPRNIFVFDNCKIVQL